VSSEALLAALAAGEPGRLDVDPAAQLARAETDVAVGWLDGEAFVTFAGADRADFLHRLLTADLAQLAADRGRRSLLLDTRGRIVADLDLWGGEQAWLGAVDRQQRPALVEQLRRYVLRADVTIEADDRIALVLAGPGSDELLRVAGAAEPDARYVSVDAIVGGAAVRLLRSDRFPWGCVLVVEEGVEAVVRALHAAAPGLASSPAASSRRRPGSTVRSASRKDATWARRPWRGFTIAVTSTGSFAGCS
jgi:folate-binding Fe-S cluster repair protein YgfZ